MIRQYPTLKIPNSTIPRDFFYSLNTTLYPNFVAFEFPHIFSKVFTLQGIINKFKARINNQQTYHPKKIGPRPS